MNSMGTPVASEGWWGANARRGADAIERRESSGEGMRAALAPCAGKSLATGHRALGDLEGLVAGPADEDLVAGFARPAGHFRDERGDDLPGGRRGGGAVLVLADDRALVQGLARGVPVPPGAQDVPAVGGEDRGVLTVLGLANHGGFRRWVRPSRMHLRPGWERSRTRPAGHHLRLRSSIRRAPCADRPSPDVS